MMTESVNLSAPSTAEGMGIFGRFLTLWVALAIVGGILIGQFIPAVPETLARFEYAQVSIPVALLIWAMIFPMMVQVDFTSVLAVHRQPKGLIITTSVPLVTRTFLLIFMLSVVLLILFLWNLKKPILKLQVFLHRNKNLILFIKELSGNVNLIYL